MTPNERGAEQTVAGAHSTQPSINPPSIWTTAACRRPQTWRLRRVSNLRNKVPHHLIHYCLKYLLQSLSSVPTFHIQLGRSSALERGHLLLLLLRLFCASLFLLVFAALFCWRRRCLQISPTFSHPAPVTPNGHIDHSQVCLPDSTHPFLLRVA